MKKQHFILQVSVLDFDIFGEKNVHFYYEKLLYLKELDFILKFLLCLIISSVLQNIELVSTDHDDIRPLPCKSKMYHHHHTNIIRFCFEIAKDYSYGTSCIK